LKREVRRYVRTHIRNGTALGELDHPSYTSPTFRSLNLGNISHQVLMLTWNGDNLMGMIEVLPTPSGKIVMDLMKSGCQVGVSSRGWASLQEEKDCIRIQNDFELITFDFVTEPSTHGAFLQPVETKIGRTPEQSAAVALSRVARLDRNGLPQNPMVSTALTVLPMDRALKASLASLHRRLEPRILSNASEAWTSAPEGDGTNIGDSSPGQGQATDPTSINAKLPPHPTKLQALRSPNQRRPAAEGAEGPDGGERPHGGRAQARGPRRGQGALAGGGSRRGAMPPDR